MISIVIPIFNAAKTLTKSLTSVISQEFSDWELILINDGSEDNSKKLAESFLTDTRIKLFNQENKGVSAARNYGAKLASGQWLIFLDSDDFFLSGVLRKIFNSDYLEADIIQWGVRWDFGSTYKDQLPEGDTYLPFLSGSFMLRKELFHRIGGFDELLKFGENTELFHRASLLNPRIQKLCFLGLSYTNNPDGGSKNLQNMIDSNLLILKKHKATLSNNTKHLYHQVIGVNQIRFRRFPEARKHLWQAYIFKPLKFSTLGRFFISLIPVIAKKLYTSEVNFS